MILSNYRNFTFKTVVFSLLFVLSIPFFGQDDLVVYGIIRDKDSAAKLEAASCVVTQDGKSFDNMMTNKNGKYEFDMPLGYVYDFKFSLNGYAHKIIQVDTKNMNPEDHAGGFEMNMDITLFEAPEEFDLTIMDRPFGKATFDNIRNDLSFDFDYTEKQNQKVEDELDRVEKLIANREKMQKEFDQLVAKGDDKMLEDKYADAIEKYEAALKIFPNEEPVKKKLAEAEKLLAESQQNAKAESDYQKYLADGKQVHEG